MPRRTESRIDTLMAKRIRWENSRDEEKEFKRTMAEKLKRDMEEPKTVGSFGKKKSKKKDPFEGMGMGSAFGMPIARYAYDAAEEPDKKPKKKEEWGI
jgi:hypothetical protein